MHTIFWEDESKSAAVRGGRSVGHVTLSLEVGGESSLEESRQRKLVEEVQSKFRGLCGLRQLKR